MKRTEWFDGKVKPARRGVYERKFSFGVLFSHWNGRYWGFCESTPKDACRLRMLRTACNVPWRGLTQPAEA